MITTLTTEDIKTFLFQLPIPELLKLIAEVEEKLDTTIMMQLAETAFDEWNDPEEDTNCREGISSKNTKLVK